jgi:nucleoside-diphosphate-sugar epimerase
MRVLLTGGYGCIGSWIVRLLLGQGHQAWIYDLKQDLRRIQLVLTPEQLDAVGFIQGDVTDVESLRAALTRHDITHVIHLAGLQVPTCRADPMLGARVNVVGTLAVFEAVRALQPQVQRLVYASSAAVYGPQPPGQVRLKEDEGPPPTTQYGFFKRCNEGNAAIYFQDHRLSSIGLRPWTVYGVGRDFGMTSEPTRALKALVLGRPYHISFGGWQDLQYVEDVARVFVRCLEVPYQGAKSYNLRGDVVDLPTFHRTLCSVEPAAQQLVTYGERQIGIAWDLDDSALERDIGAVAKTSLEEGIRQTLEMFRTLAGQGQLETYDLDG